VKTTRVRPGGWRRSGRALLGALALVSTVVSSAAASDQIYFSATDNVTNVLIQYINAEKVRLDISSWYLSEHAISIAIANRFHAGVAVRIIGDRAALFENDAHTKDEFYWLASQGVPIRLRFNPTWFPELDHWKAAIFVGQNVVEFGSGNFAPTELAPVSSTNYDDETELFTSDSTLVNAFKTRFDVMWNDTTNEPGSVTTGPYLKTWDDACTNEPTGKCAEYYTLYPNRTPMNVNTARLEPDYATPPDLIWGQGSGFNDRLTQEIYKESKRIDLIVYRLEVDNITQALLDRFHGGVPVRIIVDPGQYTNIAWPEYWLTHANIDKLWAAGVQVRQRVHDGVTHMKTLVTSTYASNASSNFGPNWQRDHDYFVSAATKPTIYQAIANRVQAMWNDTTGFAPFRPTPPNAAALASPSSGATAVSTTPTLVWNIAPWAVSYDVYLGTSQSNLTLVGNVPAVMTTSPPSTYSWTASSALLGGTTYYWKIVSRTNATPIDPTMIATSAIWSFTTAGSSGGGGGTSSVPAPWVAQDVGAVGIAGSATYSNGTFTVKGAGADIWGSADSFRFVDQSINGDATIVARVTGMTNSNTWAKAGVMIRASTAADAANVLLDETPGGSIEFLERSSAGTSTIGIAGGSQGTPVWLKLARSGSTVTASISANGSTWTSIGSTTLSIGATALVGLAVTSHDTTVLNTSTFDNVTVTTGSGGGGGGGTTASNIVIYATDVAASARHGSWTTASSSSSPNGVKLVTPNNGSASTGSPLASPTDYVDVTFTAVAGTPYRLWLRLQALNNDKLNDSVWVQFSDAMAGGSSVYPLNSTSGLLVNLATDSTASSLSGWGWQNTAYWLSQATTLTFSTTGTHTMRIQVREDGVQLDQIVLSPTTYLNAAPGPPTSDSTIVPK